MKKEQWRYKNDWLEFYPKFDRFSFMFGPASYFDSRWYAHIFVSQIVSVLAIILGLIFGLGIASLWFGILFFIPWGSAYVHFPIRSKWDECDPPQWGIKYHGNGLWFHWGDCEERQHTKRYYVLWMPWEYKWIRTSKLKKEAVIANPYGPADSKSNRNDWLHETKANRLNFWDMKDILWRKEYSYTYVLKSGEIQHRIATVSVEEREWRMKWLTWTKLFNKVSREIWVEFNNEVGEGTGSWKGGTTGCGYSLLYHESPEECLRRMEKERKFGR